MQAGGDDSSAITDINVAPLVDIALVLVIIFMVTAPMVIQSGIIVNSSKVTASHGKATKDEAIQMKLTRKGIIVNNNMIIPIKNNEKKLFFEPKELKESGEITESDDTPARKKLREETRAKFVNYMKKELAKNKQKLIIITSDRNVPHLTVVWALDASKQAGAKKLSIMREDKKKKK